MVIPFTSELGGSSPDPGSIPATDICAGSIPASTGAVVNVNVVGTNLLSYTANDGNGNNASVTRTVIVRDTTPPSILWSFTNLVLAAGVNCNAMMPDVTGTNYILATDLSGTLTILQTPTNNSPLPLGTNIVVITINDASGNTAYSTNTIVVQDQTLPQFATQPQNQTNNVGTSASFSVTASACTSLSYQWYFGTNSLAGQTNSALSLPSVAWSNAGNYHVVTTSAGGSTSSDPASLQIIVQAPTLVGGQILGGGSFQLMFGGPPGQTYQVLAADDLKVFLTNWTVLGSGTFADTNASFTDSDSTNRPNRYYIIKSPCLARWFWKL